MSQKVIKIEKHIYFYNIYMDFISEIVNIADELYTEL